MTKYTLEIITRLDGNNPCLFNRIYKKDNLSYYKDVVNELDKYFIDHNWRSSDELYYNAGNGEPIGFIVHTNHLNAEETSIVFVYMVIKDYVYTDFKNYLLSDKYVNDNKSSKDCDIVLSTGIKDAKDNEIFTKNKVSYYHGFHTATVEFGEIDVEVKNGYFIKLKCFYLYNKETGISHPMNMDLVYNIIN